MISTSPFHTTHRSIDPSGLDIFLVFEISKRSVSHHLSTTGTKYLSLFRNRNYKLSQKYTNRWRSL